MTSPGDAMIEWQRNNLGGSSSPYLRQHAGNPVWWQEWSSEVLSVAAELKKPLFVSVGYSTCHWCHVMAAEAFSDPETAGYLNTNFISVKVDREQRPDIDQYLMNFIQAQTGSGGWPLNVFMTYDMKPVHALTYAPVRTAGTRHSLLDITKAVVEFLGSRADSVMPFDVTDNEAPAADAERITESLSEYYDGEYGGFGGGQKFPPHSTLLFMLYRKSTSGNFAGGEAGLGGGEAGLAGGEAGLAVGEAGFAVQRINIAGKADGTAENETGSMEQEPGPEEAVLGEMVTTTLDAIMMRGLNDHLQGGIFRYCVDREWTIPHFEKMLYDQAMALWSYSLAFRVTGSERYRAMAEKIVRCLHETFADDGFYVSAFNADTDHREGATYLWSMGELAALLTPEEMGRFREVYEITDRGNFEGLNHLVRKNDGHVTDIEEKLLTVRRQRSQPSRDDKVLSGLNALTAVSLIQAGRMLDRPELEAEAAGLTWRLLETFWDSTTLAHSYFDGVLQRQGFLSDAGALLLAITMLYESDLSWHETMNAMTDYVRSFRDADGRWIESDADDFQKIYASWFDHPVPSAVSLAEMALTRVALLAGTDLARAVYRRPYQSDFYNINVLMNEDLFYLYTSREPLPWGSIPVNSLQRRGEPESVCHNKTCRPLS